MESRIVVTELEHVSSAAASPFTIRLPPDPEDHADALVNAWTGHGLTIADRRSSMRFEAGDGRGALAYYAVLFGFALRWVEVHVNGVPLPFERIYEESRRLPDAGRPAERVRWAQIGGDDPGFIPHAVVESEADLTPETVSLIRYADRVRLVPPARTKAALTCLARVAGVRLIKDRRRFPFLSTGREPEPAGKDSPDQGIDLEILRLRMAPQRRTRKGEVFDTVPPGTGRGHYRMLAEANVTAIESILSRLGASEADGVWACPAAGHTRDPRASFVIRKNMARCLGCDPAYLGPAGLVALRLDITPDEAASLILDSNLALDRPVPGYRRPELVAPPRPGTLVTAYVSAAHPDRFDCVIYDAGIGRPREAVLWRPDTANLPPDVAGVELKPSDTVTALVTEAGEPGPYQLSISEPELAARAIASQVPEIADGTVAVVAFARVMGSRTKVAVAPTAGGLNAVGVTLGKRDSHHHLEAARRVLNRHKLDEHPETWEKLEIIAYADDQRTYLMNAIRPIEAVDCRIRRGRAVVSVPLPQYRGGVGQGGLNAQLAGQLTGLHVEVVPDGTDLDAALDAARRR